MVFRAAPPRRPAGSPSGEDAAGPPPRGGLAGALAPASVRGARWSVGTSAALALIVVVAVVALVSAVRTAQASPGVPVPARAQQSTVPSLSEPSEPSGAGSAAPPVTTGTAASTLPAGAPGGSGDAVVVVHVVGAVAAPGVVTLAAGSRVADALTAVGGPGPDADLARVNLARVLLDGEQVVVPRPGEELPGPVPGAATGGPDGGGTAAPTGPLDLNTVTLDELDTLPGIGPVLAQRILDFRTEHGAFTSVGELQEVSGIGDAVMADLEPLVGV